VSRPRRRRYVRSLVCPTCGGTQFAEALHEGGRTVGCVQCFLETGDVPPEPREVLEAVSDPPTRTARVLGVPVPTPLRTTRSR
jgi:Zn ribbon nucleic-acid-binding protein